MYNLDLFRYRITFLIILVKLLIEIIETCISQINQSALYLSSQLRFSNNKEREKRKFLPGTYGVKDLLSTALTQGWHLSQMILPQFKPLHYTSTIHLS